MGKFKEVADRLKMVFVPWDNSIDDPGTLGLEAEVPVLCLRLDDKLVACASRDVLRKVNNAALAFCAACDTNFEVGVEVIFFPMCELIEEWSLPSSVESVRCFE